jgi:hypothetical protein
MAHARVCIVTTEFGGTKTVPFNFDPLNLEQ